HLHRHLVAVDLHVVDQTEIDDVDRDLGIVAILQGFINLFFGDHGFFSWIWKASGDDDRRAAFFRALRGDRELPGQPGGDLEKALAHRRARVLYQNRHALVAAFAQRRRDRNFAEVRNLEALGRAPGAAAGKNLVLLAAAVADKIAHVLDDADDRDHHLVEHRLGADH